MTTLLQLAFIVLISLRIQSDSEKGIVYFSYDTGKTWENKSKGLPDNIFLSDMATGTNFLGLTTKHNGIFIFDFPTNQWRKTETVPIENDEINVMYFYHNQVLVGTRNNGLFISSDKGRTWTTNNNGLKNLTIRRILAIEDKLYVGTNGGLFSFDELHKKWKLMFGQNGLQVNGIREFDKEIYIGTNQGVFKLDKIKNEWKNLMQNHSLHTISTDRKNIYALTYNELFVSSDNGNSWKSDQQGMPVGKYSFQVLAINNTLLAGQWDGVYSKTDSQGWKLSNEGLPAKFPVLELTSIDNLTIAASSQWSTQ